MAPQQSTTDVTEIEAVQRTEVLDRQSGSEVLGETDTGDECSPPQSVDILDGKSRPMSRAMDQYGWSASSFEESPAGCRCGWKSKCGRGGNVESESVQTGIFSHIQKWQTV